MTILEDYKKATGAIINHHKSHALALGAWPKSNNIKDIHYVDNIKILGFQLYPDIQKSRKIMDHSNNPNKT